MKKLICLILLVGLLVSSPLVAYPATAGETLPTSFNRFGLEVFNQLKTEAGKNVFLSPPSLAQALSLVAAGARGKTRRELQRVLKLADLSLTEINRANNQLLDQLGTPDTGVQLKVANSLWIREGFPVRSAYSSLARKSYSARVEALDFQQPGAAERINGWVKEQTANKISEMVKQEKLGQLVTLLLNAIYFKGRWQQKFRKKRTTPGTFFPATGPAVSRPMMHQSSQFDYLENELCRAVELPYGTGRVSMYLFLPRKELGLKKFVEKFSFEKWSAWREEFQSAQVKLTLPRFKIKFKRELKGLLKRLGAKRMFSKQRADFGEMVNLGKIKPRNAYVDFVKHKSFVEVNEEGTEAAAATGVGMRVTAVPKFETLKFNRPFFFLIRDRRSGLLLFLGSLKQPGKN